MSNMSYCRFENTVTDLRDCAENITEMLDDDDEIRARRRLVKLCASILEDLGFEVRSDATTVEGKSLDGAIDAALADSEETEQEGE